MINLDLHDVHDLVLERVQRNLVGFVRTMKFKAGGQEIVINLFTGNPSDLQIIVEDEKEKVER